MTRAFALRATAVVIVSVSFALTGSGSFRHRSQAEITCFFNTPTPFNARKKGRRIPPAFGVGLCVKARLVQTAKITTADCRGPLPIGWKSAQRASKIPKPRH